jgi:hypothetical protein
MFEKYYPGSGSGYKYKLVYKKLWQKYANENVAKGMNPAAARGEAEKRAKEELSTPAALLALRRPKKKSIQLWSKKTHKKKQRKISW